MRKKKISLHEKSQQKLQEKAHFNAKEYKTLSMML